MTLTKDQLRVGDVVFVSGSGLYERAIQFITKSKWNHVAVIQSIDNGTDWSVTVGEALANGFNLDQYSMAYLMSNCAVARPAKDITTEQIDKLQASVASYLGDAYDFWDIARIFCKITFNRVIGKPTAHELICSEAVVDVYESIPIEIVSATLDPSLVSPADIYASQQDNLITWA